ncbi:hypothetical protein DF286_11685 [Sphingosinicella humi]|uniref:Uncharacterized protein n=1 Tax=Allosphingosinicella humi TaxID=2068657 RepID=A0A2U2J547_9SPHN|nr:hypothetical protein DF286_11685 [Sphingosinicella humi]
MQRTRQGRSDGTEHRITRRQKPVFSTMASEIFDMCMERGVIGRAAADQHGGLGNWADRVKPNTCFIVVMAGS